MVLQWRLGPFAQAKTLIQSDPRVFRGSTVAPHRVSAEAEAPQRRVRRGKPKESARQLGGGMRERCPLQEIKASNDSVSTQYS